MVHTDVSMGNNIASSFITITAFLSLLISPGENPLTSGQCMQNTRCQSKTQPTSNINSLKVDISVSHEAHT